MTKEKTNKQKLMKSVIEFVADVEQSATDSKHKVGGDIDLWEILTEQNNKFVPRDIKQINKMLRKYPKFEKQIGKNITNVI